METTQSEECSYGDDTVRSVHMETTQSEECLYGDNTE